MSKNKSKAAVTSLTTAQINTLYATIMMDRAFREKFLRYPRESTYNRLGFALSNDECDEVQRQAAALRQAGADADGALKGSDVQTKFIKFLGLGDDGGDMDP